MKQFIKKSIVAFAATALVLSGCLSPISAAASYAPSDWAVADINNLEANSIVPEILKNKDYSMPVTRGEFCYLAMNLYKNVSKNNDFLFGTTAFGDTYDITICAAADLGIISGRPDGNFYPDDFLTRQELACVLGRTLSICGIDTSVSGESVQSTLSPFSDSIEVYSWAYNNLTYCLLNGIIKGTSQNTVSPNMPTTREQAMVMANRAFELFTSPSVPIDFSVLNPYDNLSCEVSGEIQFVSFSDRALTFGVPYTDGAVMYTADVFLSMDNFWYADSDTYVKTINSPTPQITIKNMRAGKKYRIVVNAVDANGGYKKVYTGFATPDELFSLQEKEAIIFGDGDITSKEIADSKMKSITVKVWKINSAGNKYPSEMTLCVHQNIAEITKLVFEEIFAGEEKFPFKDGGAYSWRDTMSSGRYSHHNYGTAIDLNYNENYCLYKNGSYIGKYYKPGEDIYSFPPDGEVISIFAKYGFAWGGDEWSNPNDYMHFSYLEL